MPRVTRKTPKLTDRFAGLVEILATELRADDENRFGQPIIIEDCTDQTKTMRVHVVWDRWTECPEALRGDVILAAYKQAFGDSLDYEITMALGTTVAEAFGMGILPYEIVPGERRDDPISADQYLEAMASLGGSSNGSNGRPHLRFATLDHAKAAYRELERRLPGSDWIIKQYVYDGDSWDR